jgi:thiazole/oxazole-forming peptide maturase SagD family component
MNTVKNKNTLCNSPGFITLVEYIDNLVSFGERGQWRIPFGYMEWIHIYIVKFFIRISWLAKYVYIMYPHKLPPSYNVLVTYLMKHRILDSITESGTGMSGLYSYYAEKKIVSKKTTYILHAGAVASTQEEALSKTIGEILERAIGGVMDSNTEITFEKKSDIFLRSDVIYPPRHHEYLDVQMDNHHELRTDDSSIALVKGVCLATGENVLIPKDMTSWFFGTRENDHLFINATTNGSAGSFTKEDAILGGLYEVIERDAFLVHWLIQTVPDCIHIETLPSDILLLVDLFKNKGIEVTILDTMTDTCVPTVAIFGMVGNGEDMRVVVSAAAGFTYVDAIRKALTELVIVSQQRIDFSKKINIESITPFVSTLDKDSRPLLWLGSDAVKRVQWFLSGKVVPYATVQKKDLKLGNNKSDLVCVLSKLKHLGKGYYPVVYYPEHFVLNELNYYIAQVFVENLFPLYLVECYGTFKSKRLESFALFKNKPNWKLNPVPHMFI